jgi:hypothetical protein
MFTARVVLAVNGLALILMALYFLLVQRRVAALLTLELHHSLLHEWISVGRPCVLWVSLFPVNTLSVLLSVSEYLCVTRNPDEGYHRARETF